jgi:hypothetical protein
MANTNHIPHIRMDIMPAHALHLHYLVDVVLTVGCLNINTFIHVNFVTIIMTLFLYHCLNISTILYTMIT